MLNKGSSPYSWYQKDGVPMLIPYKPAELNNNYYEIRTAEDLFWFAAQTNGYNSAINGKLMNDINLNPDYTFTFQPDTGLVKVEKAGGATVYLGTGIKGESGGIDTFDAVASSKGSFYSSNTAIDTTDEPTDLVQWTPISEKYDFNYWGTFDGNGHVIKNLYINSPSADDQGLFGHPDRSTIQNLGLVDCAIIGNNNVGGIVGITSYASVNTCFVTGVVAGNEKVGGIYGSIDNNSASNIISAARVSGANNVGVIVGFINNSSVSNSIGLKDNSIPLFGSGINQGTNVIELSDLSTGEACLIMNGNSSLNPTWFQNIGEGGDEYPVLDSTHGVVYQTNDGYASCNEHDKDGSGFCGRCGHYLSDDLKPNKDGVFEIDNAKKLLWFSYYVEYIDTTANAILTSNIDLSEVCGDEIGNWKPIGNISKSYTGTFDGNNHIISNLYINISSSYSALFGQISKGAEITNLSIENANITCSSSASILVGSNISGLISHCSVSGNITVTGNNMSVGGVCAINSFGTISDCHSNATVIVNGNNNSAGGVCGKNANTSKVINSINTGSVTATGDNNNVGSVIGFDNNTAISVVTNNYYLADSETDSFEGTTFKTAAQFASGEVAYLLNSGVTDGTQPWYQTCGAGIPAFIGETVYSYTNCKNEPKYTNDVSLSGLKNQHKYENGICAICGKFQAAVLNNEVYEIGNAGQLMWFSSLVNGDIVLDNNLSVQAKDANACLTDDITLDNRYKPIGIGAEYIGVFDGQGHTVTFNITESTEYDAYGLFGTIAKGGSISNLKLAGSITSTSGWDSVGALAGNAFATPITNVISTVNIENKNENGKVGGLVGYFGGRELAVMNNCGVSADVSGGKYVGGIIGAGWDGTQFYTVTNCFYIGDVKSTNETASVGAVVGCSMTNNSNYYGKVTLQNVYYNTVSSAISAIGSWKLAAAEAAAQISKLESVTASQFASGSVAWLLNTAGVSSAHSGIWSQDEKYPIFADGTHKAIYQITISGAKTAEYYTDASGKCASLETVYITNPSGINTETVHNSDTSYTADAAITGVTPTVYDSITLKFEVTVSNTLSSNAPVLDILFDNKQKPTTISEPKAEGDYTTYTFTLSGILPQQMTKSISATLMIDGTEYATKSEYSVKRYAFNRLSASENDIEKKFLVNMLYYGAAAQSYLNGTENLATEGLEELLGTTKIAGYRTSEADWANESTSPLSSLVSVKNVTKTNEDDLITWKSATLVFDTTITMRLRFTTTADIKSLTGYTFDSSFGDDINITDAVHDTKAAADPNNVDLKTYYIDIEGFKPTDYSTPVTVTLYDSGETPAQKSETVTYSVMSYIANKKDSETMQTLVRALYDYGISGKAYSESLN